MPARAHERAKALDGGIEQSLAGLALPSVRDSFAQIRAYLQWQDAALGHGNSVPQILKKEPKDDLTFITLGPSFDKGPTDSHFYLESGSRLSFFVELREGNGRCSLVRYRFQLNLPESQSPSFYRFDLNEKAHERPLIEPRCHYHLGVDNVRLPCPVLTPLEVSDRIFLVIEPQLLGAVEL